MVANGVALVPTVLQTDKFPEYVEAARDKFPTYATTMEPLHRRRRDVLMAAYDAGVDLYVGSDGGGSTRHGCLHEEIIAMSDMGLPACTSSGPHRGAGGPGSAGTPGSTRATRPTSSSTRATRSTT